MTMETTEDALRGHCGLVLCPEEDDGVKPEGPFRTRADVGADEKLRRGPLWWTNEEATSLLRPGLQGRITKQRSEVTRPLGDVHRVAD